jgi:hypothetical protein
MLMESATAEFKKEAFLCPRCDAYAHMTWRNLLVNNNEYSHVWTARCAKCSEASVWLNEDTIERRTVYGEQIPARLLFPAETPAPMPNPDLPDDCMADYLEAREIASRFPRGAAALLRLVIQKLCIHFGEPGKDINQDIASLVRKGLPKRLQEAMDMVRGVGNEAVHPGELDLNDSPAVVDSLFKLVNLIVEKMITEEKEFNDLYHSLPSRKLEGIEQRDK